MELPPLVSSLIIRGLPPRQQSMFAVEAEERLLKFAERWQIKSFESYIRLSISCVSFLFSGAVSCDHLVSVALITALTFIIDDLLLDTPNDLLLEEYGIHRSVRESHHKIGECLNNLNLLFRQQEPPRDPTPIEGIMWEAGQDVRRLSSPEWLNYFADSVILHHRAGVASPADIAYDRSYLQDLDSYTQLRAWNFGSLFVVNMVEFSKNAFLPDEARTLPFIQQLNNAAGMHAAFVNDIFSYYKEVQENNPRNLIMVLMQTEGTPLPQAAWRAVDVVNSYARVVLELETQLAVWDAEPWAYALRSYVEGLKELMTGSVYWHSIYKRYRHPDSVFPELRAITS